MNHSYLRPIFFACLLLFSQAFQAQTAIQVDTSANWQQWISTILGGECIQISNVTFSNQPASAARFTNGDVIGLTDGIALSTGQLTPDIDSTADLFLAYNFTGGASDTLLESYALQNLGYTGDATSYDATRLEFDFYSATAQTLSIRFVFASEEYPEFAPPLNNFFNDIFGFFVSEQGSSTYTNIALVPGTNLPVTIGNINAVTNAEYYLESTGTMPFAFDGFSVPLTATFNAEAGITYHLVIAIADIGDGVFDSAVFLEKATNESQTIQGTAFAGLETMDAGDVNLWGFSIEPGAFPALDTTAVSAGGAFSFNQIDAGLYLIQTQPDQSVYPLSVPTYYPGTALWEDASPVSVVCESFSIDGNTIVINSGPGGITGTIGGDPQGGRLRSNELIPAEGIHVLLRDSATLEWRGFDASDVLGHYSFDNIAYGTYYVYPDVAGIPILEPRKVVISESEFIVSDINFQMNADGVVNIGAQGGSLSLIEVGPQVEWTITGSDLYWIGNNTKLKLGGDTLINDTTYTTIWADGILTANDTFNQDEAILIGGFRQVGTQLFTRLMLSDPYFSVNNNQDLLYFDSSWDVSDVFTYPGSDGSPVEFTITDVETVTIHGVYRTRWRFNTSLEYSPIEEFVMGIGNAKGLFNLGFQDMIVVDGIALVNVCYTDTAGQLSYMQEMYVNPSTLWGQLDQCFLMTGGFTGISKNEFHIYPNPGNNWITFQSELALQGEVVIRDLSGRILLKTHINEANPSVSTQNLQQGLYVIELSDKNGNSSFMRWLKQE